jgi:hypothetical protein
MCSPSHSEAVGMVNLEAAAASIPVITTHNTGLYDWEVGGGILVQPQTEELTKALTQVFSWIQRERNERGRRLRQLVEDLGSLMNSFKLKVSLCVLIFACSCIIFGCGSDNSSGISSSRKDQKPPGKQKAEVVEVLINGPPGQGGTTKHVIPSEMGSQILEVIPPDEAGGSGITKQEIEAATGASIPIDPESIEVIPPRKPGEPGITKQEIEAATRTSIPIDPESIEVIPPSKPGEHGVTRQEVNTIRASQKESSDDALKPPPIPPAKKSP